MQIVQQIAFIILAVFSIWLFARNIRNIKRNILLGHDEDYSDHPSQRWKNLLLLAFGQKKMFRNPLVAVMHFFIYAGFVIINIEVLEIVLDGGFGKHRLFANALGGFYTFLIDGFEILAVLVLAACIIFLVRRNILKLKRFRSHDLDGWPRCDANYILITEILLMTFFLTMNTTDRALQLRGYEHYHDVGNFLISGLLSSPLTSASTSTLQGIERTCWWLHITGIFAFLNYLPYSKHLHILLAFPNAYYTRLEPKGEMKNMPAVQNEVLYAMHPELVPAEAAAPANPMAIGFGAKDVFDLSWRNLLDAYSCTECGRCTAACPANITGKYHDGHKRQDGRDRKKYS